MDEHGSLLGTTVRKSLHKTSVPHQAEMIFQKDGTVTLTTLGEVRKTNFPNNAWPLPTTGTVHFSSHATGTRAHSHRNATAEMCFLYQ